ncbi:MAG: hypothetical protein ACON4P_02295 [Candidatus Puniceispirillales bacterium]
MPSNGAVVQSLIFHGLVVGAFVIGMPYFSRDIAPEQPILTVDIVNVVPETSLDEGAEVKEKPKQQPKPAEEPKTPPPPPPPPPPAPTPAPEPPPPAPKTAEAVPVPSPEPKPEAAPKPKKPKSKPKPIKAPPKKPVKKSPVYKKAKENQLALASKLQDLTDRQATLRRQKEEEEKKKKQARSKLDKLVAQSQKENEETAKKDEAKAKLDQIAGQALNTAPRKSSLTGVSLGDLLRNHIGKNWSPPPGAAGADALIIDIIVRLNSQAEVQHVEIVDTARFKNDDTFRAAANAARRAIFDSSPLPLPLDEFDQWKELRFKFDPRFITRR